MTLIKITLILVDKKTKAGWAGKAGVWKGWREKWLPQDCMYTQKKTGIYHYYWSGTEKNFWKSAGEVFTDIFIEEVQCDCEELKGK